MSIFERVIYLCKPCVCCGVVVVINERLSDYYVDDHCMIVLLGMP